MPTAHRPTAISLHRWRLTASSYLILCVSLLLFRAFRVVDTNMPVLTIFTLLGIAHLTVYVVIRQGWSRLLSDPSMSAVQMVQAILAITLLVHYSGPMRGAMMCLYFIVMINGVLVLKHSTQFVIAGLAIGSLLALHLYEWQFVDMTPSGLEVAQLLVTGVGLLWFCYVGGFMYQIQQNSREQKHLLRSQQQQLAESNERLQDALVQVEEIASKDALTGAWNRRYFMEQLEAEAERARRYGSPLPLAVIDLDHFKQINDQHGHGTGDLVLQRFVTTAQATLRKHDCLARLGGEEFVIIFPQTTPQDASRVINRLQAAFRHTVRSLPVTPTFSAGLAWLANGESAERLIQRADTALYQAKDRGRNRLEIAPAEE